MLEISRFVADDVGRNIVTIHPTTKDRDERVGIGLLGTGIGEQHLSIGSPRSTSSTIMAVESTPAPQAAITGARSTIGRILRDDGRVDKPVCARPELCNPAHGAGYGIAK